jgi:tetratricopeptide (TPR) repeat protein
MWTWRPAYFVGGEYSLAKDHLDLATAIFAKSLPADHPDSMLTKNVQVCLYYKLGQFEQARELGLQAAEDSKKVRTRASGTSGHAGECWLRGSKAEAVSGGDPLLSASNRHPGSN